MPEKKSATNNVKQVLENTNKTIHGIWVLLSIVSVFLIIIYFVNNRGAEEGIQGEYADLNQFGCTVTAQENVLIPDSTPLNTITQISTIDYDNDVYQTELTKNGIPAIVEPKYTDYLELDNCMREDDEVLVIEYEGKVRIYPGKLVASHLVVNDTIKGLPILVTKCNLCNSYRVYVREYRNEELFFGVSGLLYKNNDLIFDHKTESLWTQFDGTAKVGTFTDASLESLPFKIMGYAKAKELYPEAELISFDTGFRRNYEYSGFEEFAQVDDIVIPIKNFSPDLPIKEDIIGFELDGQKYAVTENRLYYSGSYEDKVAGHLVKISLVDGSIKFEIDGEEKPFVKSFWYVWYDFYPETIIL
ncbi:DUF3179 domain-containing protein [Candidatus Dojkabacteria bacterium]|uniref:DUF3179 domain-containing protein n=1 Tax=Candidatus Dojkabacteria bacterium TaxID=2099670 RepID=A0A955L511_9BACT|nr:DUF3179 domain-containing protein [Candidatus Dojkabacteria bacterium]